MLQNINLYRDYSAALLCACVTLCSTRLLLHVKDTSVKQDRGEKSEQKKESLMRQGNLDCVFKTYANILNMKRPPRHMPKKTTLDPKSLQCSKESYQCLRILPQDRSHSLQVQN
ncbi:hypothetical protein RRG08_046896 [Elysia crispata]|uniref:Uncharacterized protein n=1 Tax=Elysia crispata TaxID=231223 RepID=A0AAE0ZIZ4_9GAST|nr:hypothetical protein RRG08_046896 [Elysia crispata]